MKLKIDHLSFEDSSKNYLDVEVHHEEKWIELKIETTDTFAIESREDLDLIYNNLCKVFDNFDKDG